MFIHLSKTFEHDWNELKIFIQCAEIFCTSVNIGFNLIEQIKLINAKLKHGNPLLFLLELKYFILKYNIT